MSMILAIRTIRPTKEVGLKEGMLVRYAHVTSGVYALGQRTVEGDHSNTLRTEGPRAEREKIKLHGHNAG